MECQCWECQRSRGETPKMNEEWVSEMTGNFPDDIEAGGPDSIPTGRLRRSGRPYAGARPGEKIAWNADINGKDR